MIIHLDIDEISVEGVAVSDREGLRRAIEARLSRSLTNSAHLIPASKQDRFTSVPLTVHQFSVGGNAADLPAHISAAVHQSVLQATGSTIAEGAIHDSRSRGRGRAV